MLAILSSLAVVLTITNLTIPFPFLPYLKFDFSEIPVTIAFFLIGPLYGLASATIYWIILTIRAGDILGPAMKFAAVASMMIGFWVASELVKRKKGSDNGSRAVVALGLVVGVLFRVVIMSVFNYALFTYIAPHYLDFAAMLLVSLGLPANTVGQTLLWTLTLTGAYNLLHTLLSVVPAIVVTNASLDRIPNLGGQSWIARFETES